MDVMRGVKVDVIEAGGQTGEFGALMEKAIDSLDVEVKR